MRGRIGTRRGYAVRVRAAETLFFRLAHPVPNTALDPRLELLLAIFLQAIHDLPDLSLQGWADPEAWLRSHECVVLLSRLDIEHDYVIETLESVGLLPRVGVFIYAKNSLGYGQTAGRAADGRDQELHHREARRRVLPTHP